VAPRRILMLLPVPVPQAALAMFAAQLPAHLQSADTSVTFVAAREGGFLLESPYETAMAEMFVLEAGAKAEDEGYSAVCVNSMSDTGVNALRSRLSIPVIGTGRSTLYMAASLGRRFSIITMWQPWISAYEDLVEQTGLGKKLASIRHINVRPDTSELLSGKEEIVFDAIEAASRKAITEDGADTIVLGSTTMHQSHAFLAAALPVPVLNPGLVAFKTCAMMLDLGISHSSTAYPRPAVLKDDLLATVPSRFADA
jgi:allantoin racemase